MIDVDIFVKWELALNIDGEKCFTSYLVLKNNSFIIEHNTELVFDYQDEKIYRLYFTYYFFHYLHMIFTHDVFDEDESL